VFYSLGEVVFNKGQADEAAKWYQKAADTDPSWGKPIFKLGLVALNKGDKDATLKMMEKVIASDPTSAEPRKRKRSSNNSRSNGTVSRPLRFTFILFLAALGRLWPRWAAGGTRARPRRSADRSSSSRSTR